MFTVALTTYSGHASMWIGESIKTIKLTILELEQKTQRLSANQQILSVVQTYGKCQ